MIMFILFGSVYAPRAVRVADGCGDGLAGSVGQGVARGP
jgi:hypothetical protein